MLHQQVEFLQLVQCLTHRALLIPIAYHTVFVGIDHGAADRDIEAARANEPTKLVGEGTRHLQTWEPSRVARCRICVCCHHPPIVGHCHHPPQCRTVSGSRSSIGQTCRAQGWDRISPPRRTTTRTTSMLMSMKSGPRQCNGAGPTPTFPVGTSACTQARTVLTKKTTSCRTRDARAFGTGHQVTITDKMIIRQIQ